MLRPGILIFFLLFFLSGFSQSGSGFILSGEIKNFQRPTMVYLLSIEGSTWDVADSMESQNGKVVFASDIVPPTGEYYVFWEEKYFVNLVINNEAVIQFSADNLEPDLNIQIQISQENKAFYQLRKIENEIDSLSAIGDKYYEQGLTIQLQKIKIQLQDKVMELENKVGSLEQESPGLFSVKLYKNSIPPDFKKFTEANPDYKFDSEYAFLKRHYFDNIDKKDSCLVRTRVLYDACSFYLRNFMDEKTSDGYIKAVDFIMSTFSWNDAQYNYVLNLLLNTFEASGYEEVYLHLFDLYMHGSSCEGGIPSEVERKALSIRNMKKGTLAPELTGKDRNGGTLSLTDYQGKTVIVMFWESSCEHCREAIPYVLELLADRPNIILFSFSIDTDENKWMGGMLEEKLPEPAVSDLLGYDGANAIRWNVWGTPSFFVIDPEGKIVAKPMTLQALEDVLR